jgi:hypothetical protein
MLVAVSSSPISNTTLYDTSPPFVSLNVITPVGLEVFDDWYAT